MNTRNGTVKGEIQGTKPDVEQMKVGVALEPAYSLLTMRTLRSCTPCMARRATAPASESSAWDRSAARQHSCPCFSARTAMFVHLGLGLQAFELHIQEHTPLVFWQVWLATEGSPMSHIERCEFIDERDDLEKLEYTEFGVNRRR